MTQVLVTIDTEISPEAHRRGVSADDNYRCAILGRVSDGEWGTEFQIARFNEHALKVVFFVEALSASVVGLDILRRTVAPILAAGHEVQLHIHTEWLEWFPSDPVSGRRGQNIGDFSLADQRRLIQIGLENLERVGTPRPVAFRAGNYGANNDTLRALASEGIRYDSSYNYAYLGQSCNIAAERQLLLDPLSLDGVLELPIAVLKDYPNHYRPAQLCAISAPEMRAVIEQSSTQQQQATVVVSHSFELLNRSRSKSNRLVVRRFEHLCQMLYELRATVVTKGFIELSVDGLTQTRPVSTPPKSNVLRTASRVAEQAIGTVFYG
jgi:hypothetical protein